MILPDGSQITPNNVAKQIAQYHKNKMTECVKYLYEELAFVYCESCRFKNNDNNCDDCYRKKMHWGISEEFATKLVNQLLEINNKEGEN